jgi:hypothetical protein
MSGKISSPFGSNPAQVREAHPQIAMPLFAGPDLVAPEAVVAAWAELFPELPALAVVVRNAEDGPVTYDAGGETLLALHISSPVPQDEAVRAVKSSWMWQQPDDDVRRHASHAIVTAGPSKTANPIAQAWNVSRLSAAMLRAGGGLALYWGNSRQVHLPAIVERFARGRELPPVPLWVGVTLSANTQEGPFSAATHGLEAFGHKEFEVLDTRLSIGAIRTTLVDLALYVLRNGPVLFHGQTIGATPEQKWSVTHARSKLVAGRDAIVIGIP